MTDAICCHGDVMLTSAYDLDNGQGYLNGMSLVGYKLPYDIWCSTRQGITPYSSPNYTFIISLLKIQ